ncbi:hypothetical protein M0802_000384 [Mischocyttarus mexicanus]|nr:hypothetical protein M0802_000384 [Mischocyttarus mexicanus]
MLSKRAEKKGEKGCTHSSTLGSECFNLKTPVDFQGATKEVKGMGMRWGMEREEDNELELAKQRYGAD